MLGVSSFIKGHMRALRGHVSLLLEPSRCGAEALEHQALSPGPWGLGATRTLRAAMLRVAWILPQGRAEQG